MPLWPFFCIALGAGAIALVSLDLDRMSPLLVPAAVGYAVTGTMDIYQTVRAPARIVSTTESAVFFRVSYRVRGAAMAVPVQISVETLVILVILPVLLGYGPFHAGSVSAVCMMAAATHLWGFIHNCHTCGAPERTKF